jgi:hypothetical protein
LVSNYLRRFLAKNPDIKQNPEWRDIVEEYYISFTGNNLNGDKNLQSVKDFVEANRNDFELVANYLRRFLAKNPDIKQNPEWRTIVKDFLG